MLELRSLHGNIGILHHRGLQLRLSLCNIRLWSGAAFKSVGRELQCVLVGLHCVVQKLLLRIRTAHPYHASYGPVYPASKAALNATTLAMMIELESTGIRVNLVSPEFTKTNLNGYAGTESVEDGSREVVRVALLGSDGPTGTFTRCENVTIPVTAQQ
jgi:NAD(P)-dependent dehydrogenase (short-subunit alcohol dehydrogenase family)